MYCSTKTFGHELGLSCAFRQWKADSHCRYLHGYAIAVKIVFGANELDHRNWVVDFGSLKTLKGYLENAFDHKTLVAKDDPNIDWFKQGEALGVIELHEVEKTGCEAFAEYIYILTDMWLLDNGYAPRVSVYSVEVSEHGANSAIYYKGKPL